MLLLVLDALTHAQPFLTPTRLFPGHDNGIEIPENFSSTFQIYRAHNPSKSGLDFKGEFGDPQFPRFRDYHTDPVHFPVSTHGDTIRSAPKHTVNARVKIRRSALRA